MIDHISLKVRSYSKSKTFYDKALAPLGYRPEAADDKGKSAGFGVEGAIDLWIAEGEPMTRVHLAFRAPSRAAVKKFHAAALASGGKDNGPAGLRADYSPTYFAAFILDPDGNNIEAVCHSAD